MSGFLKEVRGGFHACAHLLTGHLSTALTPGDARCDHFKSSYPRFPILWILRRVALGRPGTLARRCAGVRHSARGGGVGLMIVGWLVAAVLIYCLIRSPCTMLLVAALGAAAVSGGGR
jgi:hypothetical protein